MATNQALFDHYATIAVKTKEKIVVDNLEENLLEPINVSEVVRSKAEESVLKIVLDDVIIVLENLSLVEKR